MNTSTTGDQPTAQPTAQGPAGLAPVPRTEGVHPAWLPASALRHVGRAAVRVYGAGPLVDTVRSEVAQATSEHGGRVSSGADPDVGGPGEGQVELVLALADDAPASVLRAVGPDLRPGPGGFLLVRVPGTTTVLADSGSGLLAGFFHLVRLGVAAFAAEGDAGVESHAPARPLRMLDHWDNVDVHPTMGQVERGYSGGSLFYVDGGLRPDLGRVREYARLLAASGINGVAVNNVNVHRREAEMLTTRLDDVVALAAVFRPYGIGVHLSVSFASPVLLGGLTTADPLDPEVRAWWARATDAVYQAVPDFGGYVVKADSEGEPGPFAYGRDHADGANLLARALAPHGGTVHWRAFVYDHRQDWRDRSTDRARAAYDHFSPLDGRFDDNVVLQVKLGPIDFQVREPLSPLLAAMPRTRLAIEMQVTQEYTGQQKHVAYLGPQWSEALRFRPWGEAGPAVHEVVDGVVAVSNVGADRFWTGHPFAQLNLYALGRLAWDPALDPDDILDEWIELTFDPGPASALRSTLRAMLSDSLAVYEMYTAPLGVGFMVRPGDHYGPDVDGYEYTPWGTYHFADRDGVGVDRTCATGTGFAGLFPEPWAQTYESCDTCPDELLLFFHHVPYSHVLRSGVSVIQHIYDSHFDGYERVESMISAWRRVSSLVDAGTAARIDERLAEQRRCAREWRDQVNTYFFRTSGVPDGRGRTIY